MPPELRPLVIGVGNALRSDDGAGPALVESLKRTHHARAGLVLCAGDGASLMALWEGQHCVIVVDAVCSGAPAGTVHRFEAHQERIPSRFFNYSTHAFSLAEAVEMSRTLGTLPRRLVLFGIEGENFASGPSLSLSVQRAVRRLAQRLPRELDQLCASESTP
jgi:hydrogenase maturation protease